MKKDVMKAIADTGILPVINITDIETATELARSVSNGGIKALEITLRSEVSLEAIALIVKTNPKLSLLAGTVLTVSQAQAALDAGADALVMPGYDEELVDFAIERGVPIIPGCVTAADIQKGYKKGLRVFKFFPAEKSGGLDAIKLLAGPFKGARFLPTGGMNYSNIGSYLREKCIVACGGSYMADAALLAARDFNAIEKNCRRALEISLGFELAHIGINHSTAEEGVSTAAFIARAFGLELRDLGGAAFAGTAVESMKKQGYGKVGHIGFYTNSVERAIAYFEAQGIAVNQDSIQKNKSGELSCVYLADEVAGFALHAVKRS